MKIFSQFNLDRKSKVPFYLQIKNYLQEMILMGSLPEGVRLPPTRKLAAYLKVNRTTVVSAYEELVAEDLVESHVGRGTIVKKRKIFPEVEMPYSPLNWSEFLAFAPPPPDDSVIKDIISYSSQKNFISFGAGVPAPEVFPIKEFQEIIYYLLKTEGDTIFQHFPTEGFLPLRKMLVEWMAEEGKRVSPEEVFIVAGSQQGLYLLAKIFINPGDLIFVENPTYLGALQVFKGFQARIIGIPTDEQGLRIDVLEELISRQIPRFIYVLPSFQNPSGAVLNLERREKLLNLAYKFRVPIIEDDPYSKLYFHQPPPLSLKSLDKYNYVIYLSTFSKILFPGLRIGWLVAPRQIIERLSRTKQFLDLHCNTLGQRAIYEFCDQGLLEKHLQKVRKLYSRKRDIMITALKKHCFPHLVCNSPEGGFNLWCKLVSGFKSRELLREALDEKVVFVNGEAFHPEGKGEEYLRLNFTFQPEELIEEGIKKLGRALNKLIKKSKIERKDEIYLSKPVV